MNIDYYAIPLETKKAFSLLFQIQITITVACLNISITPLGDGFGDIDIRPLPSCECVSIAYTLVGPQY